MSYKRPHGFGRVPVKKSGLKPSRWKAECVERRPLRLEGGKDCKVLPILTDIDDFCKRFEPLSHQHLLQAGHRHRSRQPALALSEIMTILVSFHQSHYRTFKHYYTDCVVPRLRPYFPTLVSYTRFVELIPRALVPLCCYLHPRKGPCTGIAFIDSPPLSVCHNRRIASHKVFAGWATRGKPSRGWFYGVKLHLIVNDAGALLAFCLTPGHVDDRQPVPILTPRLLGQLFGARGYISQALHDALLAQGLELLTEIRKTMQHRLMRWWDKVLLRKRVLIETINDQLKNSSQIEHTRHRSVPGCMVNLLCGLVAYSFQPKKPSLGLRYDSRLPVLIM